ncbi:hypothetical protein MPOCJGCO_1900 [Methylobacterium trifolii]|uniref:Uncharacterized protein n=1 Tax=Methylobacterium trifolii TaxID=1003092 RepID=A0ABQ4U0I5_9HYPH|nr:hypothetical protein MPOCJGCO_1900 [Methylobacterium trifolii]
MLGAEVAGGGLSAETLHAGRGGAIRLAQGPAHRVGQQHREVARALQGAGDDAIRGKARGRQAAGPQAVAGQFRDRQADIRPGGVGRGVLRIGAHVEGFAHRAGTHLRIGVVDDNGRGAHGGRGQRAGLHLGEGCAAGCLDGSVRIDLPVDPGLSEAGDLGDRTDLYVDRGALGQGRGRRGDDGGSRRGGRREGRFQGGTPYSGGRIGRDDHERAFQQIPSNRDLLACLGGRIGPLGPLLDGVSNRNLGEMPVREFGGDTLRLGIVAGKHGASAQLGPYDVDAVDVAETIVEARAGVSVEQRHAIRPALRKREAFEVGATGVLADDAGAGGEHDLEGPALRVPRRPGAGSTAAMDLQRSVHRAIFLGRSGCS